MSLSSSIGRGMDVVSPITSTIRDLITSIAAENAALVIFIVSFIVAWFASDKIAFNKLFVWIITGLLLFLLLTYV